ncbi:MAG: alpha/beta fold hydrolase [Anaerolineae bacterium]|nr:alpha/beta fold hydrolase [Anaerolineae bacterium]
MSLANQLDSFTLFAPDILGHGLSESPRGDTIYTMAVVASHLLFIMEHHKIEQFHLLGYSMGGRLALYIATHYPDRVKSLILESASPGLKTEAEREARRKSDNDLADKIEANGIEWFVDYWEKLPLWHTQTPGQRAYLREQRLKNDPVGLANSLRGMGTGVMPSLWDKLSELLNARKIDCWRTR